MREMVRQLINDMRDDIRANLRFNYIDRAEYEVSMEIMRLAEIGMEEEIAAGIKDREVTDVPLSTEQS